MPVVGALVELLPVFILLLTFELSNLLLGHTVHALLALSVASFIAFPLALAPPLGLLPAINIVEQGVTGGRQALPLLIVICTGEHFPVSSHGEGRHMAATLSVVALVLVCGRGRLFVLLVIHSPLRIVSADCAGGLIGILVPALSVPLFVQLTFILRLLLVLVVRVTVVI